MSSEIKVPALGESITEATIAKWCKNPGDTVQIDELLLELETEKVTLEVNASSSGTLGAQNKAEGDVVVPGEVIGVINEGKVKHPENKSTIDTQPKADNIQNTSQNRNVMPPSVRKLISENNLNPKDIKGTGKDGRVNKGDVLSHLSNDVSTTKTQTALASKEVEIIKMSRLRKTIAERLKHSQNTAAILTTFNEIDMTNVMNLRKRLRDEFQNTHDVKLGFMSFFVKAVVRSLQVVPSVNAEIDGDQIIYKKFYDIGVAVGTAQGLVVPVVPDCHNKTFAEIEKNIVSLSVSAKEGKLKMSDLTGGTFSITNGGVYGSLLSTPIINPPQTGILGLHNIVERPMVVNGKIEARSMMYIALSYDHRIIDGKDAVTFLINIKKSIEDPERLMLDI